MVILLGRNFILPASDGTSDGMASCSALGARLPGGLKGAATQTAVTWCLPGGLKGTIHVSFLGPWGQIN